MRMIFFFLSFFQTGVTGIQFQGAIEDMSHGAFRATVAINGYLYYGKSMDRTRLAVGQGDSESSDGANTICTVTRK